MTAITDLPSYYAVPDVKQGVSFTKLADGRLLMTYSIDNSGTIEGYYIIVGPNFEDLYFPPTSIGDIHDDTPIVATATPEGGFAIMWQLSGTFKKISKIASDGTTLKSDELGGNTSEGAITTLDDGAVAYSAVYTIGNSQYVYSGSIPLFGAPDFNWQFVTSDPNEEVIVNAPVKIGVFYYTPVTILDTANGTTESKLIRVNSNSTDDLAMTSEGTRGHEELMVQELANGKFLVLALDGTSSTVLIFDSSMVQEAATELNNIQVGTEARLIELVDGTYALIYNVENSSTGRVVFFDEEGNTSGIVYPISLPYNFSTGHFSVFPLEDGGYGLVQAPASGVGNDEDIAIYDQGSPFPDEQRLRFEGEFDGGDGPDILGGSSGDDTIIGGTGPDGIWGFDGNDFIFLDEGPTANYISYDSAFESAWGGVGDDFIQNDSGDSKLYGELGNDTLIGGTNVDKAWGDDGDDVMRLGSGNDKGYGGKGRDIMLGEEGNDVLRGGFQNDVLLGGTGSDKLYGSFGKDLIRGNQDNDFLFGGNGDDTLSGGDGDDVMQGGDGNDVFVFRGDGAASLFGGFGDPETDVIVDFVRGEDKIKIRDATGVSAFSDISVTGTGGGGSIIEYGDRLIIVNANVSGSDFDIA
ncbi:MAG: calcium-binding protein [Pseudomonadota bacterium]